MCIQNFLSWGLILWPLSQPAVHVQGQEPLTASILAAAPPQEQKQMLGKCHRFMIAYPVGLTVCTTVFLSYTHYTLSDWPLANVFVLHPVKSLVRVHPPGEHLFPLIQKMHQSLAGKITGMLLEIDNSELLLMLVSPESLRSKVRVVVLFCFLAYLEKWMLI